MKEVSLSEKEKLVIFIKKIINEFFSFSLILYLTLFFLEEIKPNFVGNYLSMNYFLILAIISGILVVLTKSDEINKSDRAGRKIKKIDYILAFILGIITIFVIHYKITDVNNWLSLIISFMSGLLIFLMAIIFFNKD